MLCTLITAQGKNPLFIKGLKAKVEVLRDKWGVNHIYATNQHDLFFTQGYCAAKDRLFQFEIWRRQATGTVAEILGAREIKRDIGTRLFKYRGDMKKEFSHYHPQGKAIISAYADGVNAYVVEALAQPEKLPVEFRLLHIKPGKWTPEVVISRHQGILGNITEELNIGRAVAAAGEAKVKDLMWFHPKEPVLKLDSTIKGNLLFDNILELYNAFRKDVVFEPEDIDTAASDVAASLNTLNKQFDYSYDHPFEHGLEGSNNWVVSGGRTVSGYPMLANDPHRKIAIPSLRYIVHLVAPGWNVVGGGEPEIPGVSIGHNEAGAWGITISETDGEDLCIYDLNPGNLNQYLYKGKWMMMKEIHETINVKNAKPEKVTLRYTLHGPVTYIDSVNHKAYAVRSASLEPGGAPYLSSLRIDQAKTWDMFRDACTYSNIPALNIVWADKQGDIGWQVAGIIPIRKNFSGLVPVPGDGRYEWAGYLPIKERPHILNPAKGFFATANQNLTPDNYPHPNEIGYTWADAFRGNRINEALSADDKMSVEKMKKLQTDYLSLPARTLVPMLGAVAFDTDTLKQARELLINWDFVLNKNSIPAAIYAMWERTIMEQANKKLIPENLKGLINLQTTKVISWLQSPDKKFGIDPLAGRDRFLKETFEIAVDQLKDKLGNSLNRWQYGQEKYKHITFIHPLSNVVNEQWKNKLNTVTLSRGGNGHTTGSTGNTDNQSTGASFRLIADVSNWDNSVMINTPGQSGDPSSPFYKNLFELWANDQYFPAYYSKQKILSVTKEKTSLQPFK